MGVEEMKFGAGELGGAGLLVLGVLWIFFKFAELVVLKKSKNGNGDDMGALLKSPLVSVLMKQNDFLAEVLLLVKTGNGKVDEVRQEIRDLREKLVG